MKPGREKSRAWESLGACDVGELLKGVQPSLRCEYGPGGWAALATQPPDVTVWSERRQNLASMFLIIASHAAAGSALPVMMLTCAPPQNSQTAPISGIEGMG